MKTARGIYYELTDIHNVPGDLSFRPTIGVLLEIEHIKFAIWCIVIVYLAVLFLVNGIDVGFFIDVRLLLLWLLIIISALILILIMYLFRARYVLTENGLFIRQFAKRHEIEYASIRRVEEIAEPRGSARIEAIGSRSSQHLLGIWFIDENGKEDVLVISPARKQEFLSNLRTRIPDPNIFLK